VFFIVVLENLFLHFQFRVLPDHPFGSVGAAMHGFFSAFHLQLHLAFYIPLSSRRKIRKHLHESLVHFLLGCRLPIHLDGILYQLNEFLVGLVPCQGHILPLPAPPAYFLGGRLRLNHELYCLLLLLVLIKICVLELAGPVQREEVFDLISFL